MKNQEKHHRCGFRREAPIRWIGAFVGPFILSQCIFSLLLLLGCENDNPKPIQDERRIIHPIALRGAVDSISSHLQNKWCVDRSDTKKFVAYHIYDYDLTDSNSTWYLISECITVATLGDSSWINQGWTDHIKATLVLTDSTWNIFSFEYPRVNEQFKQIFPRRILNLFESEKIKGSAIRSASLHQQIKEKAAITFGDISSIDGLNR